MNLTNKQLKQIIKEELRSVLEARRFPRRTYPPEEDIYMPRPGEEDRDPEYGITMSQEMEKLKNSPDPNDRMKYEMIKELGLDQSEMLAGFPKLDPSAQNKEFPIEQGQPWRADWEKLANMTEGGANWAASFGVGEGMVPPRWGDFLERMKHLLLVSNRQLILTDNDGIHAHKIWWRVFKLINPHVRETRRTRDLVDMHGGFKTLYAIEQWLWDQIQIYGEGKALSPHMKQSMRKKKHGW